jgi:hypothetical protein
MSVSFEVDLEVTIDLIIQQQLCDGRTKAQGHDLFLFVLKFQTPFKPHRINKNHCNNKPFVPSLGAQRQ